MNTILKPVVLLLPVLMLVVVSTACKRQETEKTPLRGKVSASVAYETYFGKPPTPQEGTCFAMVGFLPKADDPGKVVPLPLFLFSEQERMRLLTERLITVDDDAASRVGVVKPFAPGTSLLSLSQEEDLVRVDLSSQGSRVSDPVTRNALFNALGHSLVQFPGVKKVVVTSQGEPLPGHSPGGEMPDPEALASPGPPVIIGVVATWEKGEPLPEEVSVFFDRPVEVEKIGLNDPQGRQIEGEFFRSIFDMAVVLHPRNPGAFTEGMLIRVAWKVTDYKGRSSEGDQGFHLLRMEHP